MKCATRLFKGLFNFRKTVVLCGALAVSVAGAGWASAACRQALAIGLDISGSVDRAEYRLQLDGLADALLDGDVQRAFLALPDANVRLLVFEWAGADRQNLLVAWTEVTQAGDLRRIAETLQATRRQPLQPATALGTAMLFGADMLASQGECWRRTIDLSGDGKSNSGPLPRSARNSPALVGVTINALVIGADAPAFSDETQSEIKDLSSYFQANVIKGADAFVQVAVEFAGFRDAMAKKLLKELQTRAVSSLAMADQ